MFEGSESFDEIVVRTPGHDASLMRFCLSDSVPLNIDEVVGGCLTPVEYAGRLMAKSYPLLYKRFFQPRFQSRRLPAIIKQSIMFDDLVAAACLLRAIIANPTSPQEVVNLMGKARVFFLCLEDKHYDEVAYSGLTSFKLYADEFIRTTSDGFVSNDTALLKPLIAGVSQAEDEGWILNHPHWRAALLGRPSRLLAFRGFLHVSLFSYPMMDSHLHAIFDMTRLDVMSMMYDFVELRTSRKTKQEDVEQFIKRLAMYFNQLALNTFFATMVDGPFSFFVDIHNNNTGNSFTTSNPLRLASNRG